jgi:hypothetical protein
MAGVNIYPQFSVFLCNHRDFAAGLFKDPCCHCKLVGISADAELAIRCTLWEKFNSRNYFCYKSRFITVTASLEWYWKPRAEVIKPVPQSSHLLSTEFVLCLYIVICKGDLWDGVSIAWLDLLHLIHSHSWGLQAIQRCRYSTHSPVHR